MGKEKKNSLSARLSGLHGKSSIRYSVFLTFTVSAVLVVMLTAFFFYRRFSGQLERTMLSENQILISQINQAMETYLREKMKLSDAFYYNVIKNKNLDDEEVTEKLQLLYEANHSSVENMAVFSMTGKVLATAPPASPKKNVNIMGQEWFVKSVQKTEDLHFFNPTVQSVFVDTANPFKWVIPLSSSVEITREKSTQQGVLLINLKYSGIEQIMSKATLGNGGYIYLTDREGNLIYHPKKQLIFSGLETESNVSAAALSDGNHKETFEGEERVLTVKTVGYTGWKLIGVMPGRRFSFNTFQNRLFISSIILALLLVLVMVNSRISSMLTDPIRRLEKSVHEMEEGNLEAVIYTGGSYEVMHLGRAIQDMVDEMKRLMEATVAEHESKRKSELDALQSQINPHFLYNTLDIIVWMIENEQYPEAVRIVTSLARLFRISLSRGRNIIPVRDELEHVRNYLNIQQMRFKNKFEFSIEAEEEVCAMSTIKLVVQPLAENALYHGIEFMDEEGRIDIRAWKKGGDVYLSVSDNGLGMTKETMEALLKGEISSKTKGSGIGFSNVNERIKLYFGEAYGLRIESEPDEGTTVMIHIPAVPYGEEVVRWGR
ncbi:MAG: histidine kinase [Lachnospiraceae bacterium]|nr:histidine kinase [Lachnospiraceae bacterium]